MLTEASKSCFNFFEFKPIPLRDKYSSVALVDNISTSISRHFFSVVFELKGFKLMSNASNWFSEPVIASRTGRIESLVPAKASCLMNLSVLAVLVKTACNHSATALDPIEPHLLKDRSKEYKGTLYACSVPQINLVPVFPIWQISS